MVSDKPNIDDIYFAALEKADGEQRGAYLDEACGADVELRARVKRLLSAQSKVDSFLESPAPGISASPTIDQLPLEKTGTVIGPYKLLQQIGEGGMGVVYMAEQTAPVERRVALKIIKPGMDSRQVIARFEAERQALAMMDHPHIAKVLDAGTTGSGRPYFVMELVKGVPITQYCDEKHLTLRERLELFVPVCHAIQHAHQKGIIHRDLKPTNVLVAEYDNQAIPKIIDFGVAKATGHRLTEKTMFTEFGQIVGTIEYMSPEQAKLNQLDIDTRSDIYSLGVLLYELLTGSTPFDQQRLRSAAFDEMLRIIREEEPLKPSTKLSSSNTLPAIAANRHSEPTRLSRAVRGELDWIVMKALEKDRNRRYETANGFAADVVHYLADEPVLACPPSASYRLRKFARRNKAALSMAAIVLFFLVLLGGGAGWTVREQEARRTKLAGQLELILDEIKQLQVEQKWPEALVAARRAEALLKAGGTADAALERQVQQALTDLKLVQRLETIRLEQAGLTDVFERFRWAERAYADAFRDAGVDFGRLTEEEIVQRLRARPEVAPALAVFLDEWSNWRSLSGNLTGGRELRTVAGRLDPDPWRLQVHAAFEQIISHAGGVRDFVIVDATRLPPAALEHVKALEVLVASPEATRQPPVVLYHVGMALSQGLGKPEMAVGLLRKAQMQYPGDFWINYGLGYTLRRLGPAHQDEALAFYRAAVALRPHNPWGWNLIGLSLRSHPNQLGEAIACFRKSIEIDPSFWAPHNNLGAAFRDQQKWDEAISSYRKAIELNPQSALSYNGLGVALAGQKKLDEAIDCFKKAAQRDPKFALPHANLTWHLTTALDPKLRDPQAAVAHARQAVDLAPDTPNHRSRLGVALLRAGEFKAAVETLEKANRMWTGGDHQHRFFLAMAYWQIGEKDQAQQTYEEGTQWMDKNQPENEELHRFRTEAEELMK